jgi:hypothetical protein
MLLLYWLSGRLDRRRKIVFTPPPVAIIDQLNAMRWRRLIGLTPEPGSAAMRRM